MLKERIQTIKNDENDVLNYGEFYDILSEIKNIIEVNQNTRKQDMKCLCNLLKIKNMNGLVKIDFDKLDLLQKQNRNNLIYILSLMCGDKFYSHQYFETIFKSCYNLQIPGKFAFIKRPNNLEEANKMFDDLKETITSKKITPSTFVVNQTVKRLGDLLQRSAQILFTTESNLEISYDAVNSILESCDKNQPIVIDNIEEVCNILNEQITFPDDAEDYLKELNIGDYLLKFIKGYNVAIIPTTYEDKLDVYYNNITNTEFRNFDNSILPKYEDPDFLRYMNDLENMLQENYSDNAQYTKKFVAVSMHHCSYYKK